MKPSFFPVLRCLPTGASNTRHKDIQTFQDLRQSVLHELQVRRCILLTGLISTRVPDGELSMMPADIESCSPWFFSDQFTVAILVRTAPSHFVLLHLRQNLWGLTQNPLEYAGTALRSFPRVTKIIKGLRRGELTVITGPTGSGKTTILSQLSLDLAEGGLNTLWGSFEIKNTRLMHKMLQQFAGRPLADLLR